MSTVRLQNISKKFGNNEIIKDLNLTIPDGSFLSLLGPSGCGKTTLLRMIAGLEEPTTGEIYIDDNCIFSSEKLINIIPAKRNLGFLFQNYALWPHMTVYQNIEFGLIQNKKGLNSTRCKDKIKEIMDIMQISQYSNRYPSELSGGQQQRVAIARTLAVNPPLILMDEPLSNLDAKLRINMRTELKRLHLTTKNTFVYVTHDQQEAMALSTSICLLNNGVIQQLSSPRELYTNPNNIFVADFVGIPTINILKMKIENTNDNFILYTEDLSINVNKKELDTNIYEYMKKEDFVLVGIRPEAIYIGDSKCNNKYEGEIYSSFINGIETTLIIKCGNTYLNSSDYSGIDLNMDDKVNFSIDIKSLLYFDYRSQNRIYT